jgi:hypothetical protein
VLCGFGELDVVLTGVGDLGKSFTLLGVSWLLPQVVVRLKRILHGTGVAWDKVSAPYSWDFLPGPPTPTPQEPRGLLPSLRAHRWGG